MLAYHFISPDLKTRFNNLQAVVGETLEPFDALKHTTAGQTTICLVEVSGKLEQVEDKLAASKRKLIKAVDATKMLQEFAIWCAELVLPLFKKRHPNNNRIRECIETTKKYLEGSATLEELQRARARAADAAAYAAVYAADAADAAAYAAARAADAAAYAADAAAYVADAAAYAAYAAYAADAAAYAAYAAARAADIKKQIRDEFNRRAEELLK